MAHKRTNGRIGPDCVEACVSRRPEAAGVKLRKLRVTRTVAKAGSEANMTRLDDVKERCRTFHERVAVGKWIGDGGVDACPPVVPLAWLTSASAPLEELYQMRPTLTRLPSSSPESRTGDGSKRPNCGYSTQRKLRTPATAIHSDDGTFLRRTFAAPRLSYHKGAIRLRQSVLDLDDRYCDLVYDRATVGHHFGQGSECGASSSVDL